MVNGNERPVIIFCALQFSLLKRDITILAVPEVDLYFVSICNDLLHSTRISVLCQNVNRIILTLYNEATVYRS